MLRSGCRACIEATRVTGALHRASQGLLPCNIRLEPYNLRKRVLGLQRACARTFTPVSKRPLGVSMMKDGGLKGYSGGSRMRPW